MVPLSGDELGLVRALGFVAWADDRIAPEERAMLETDMDALGVPADRRKELCEALKEGPAPLDEIRDAFTDDMERRFAVAQAILMARADGHLAEIEKQKIAELATVLGIDDEELTMLYAAVDVTDSLMVDAE